MNKKGVIFDLDGTLIDSMGMWEKVDWKLAKKYDFIPDEEYWNVITSISFLEGAEYIRNRYLLKKSKEEIAEELYEMTLYEYKNNIKLKKGAEQLLKRLKKEGYLLSIATSNVEEMTHAVLKNNGIFSYFNVFVYCDSIGKNKSFPDVYIAASKAMNLQPQECYIFEDVPHAVISAKSTGAEVIGVFDEFSKNREKEMRNKADRYIMSLEEFTY